MNLDTSSFLFGALAGLVFCMGALIGAALWSIRHKVRKPRPRVYRGESWDDPQNSTPMDPAPDSATDSADPFENLKADVEAIRDALERRS